MIPVLVSINTTAADQSRGGPTVKITLIKVLIALAVLMLVGGAVFKW